MINFLNVGKKHNKTPKFQLLIVEDRYLNNTLNAKNTFLLRRNILILDWMEEVMDFIVIVENAVKTIINPIKCNNIVNFSLQKRYKYYGGVYILKMIFEKNSQFFSLKMV